MSLIMLGHFVTLTVNLVGFAAAIMLLRYLANWRWLVSLIGLNAVVVTRRFFEIGLGFGLIGDSPLVNVFGVPFVHSTLLTTATLGVLFALRRGRGDIFRLRPEAEKRYRLMVSAADRIERHLATGGMGGGR